MALHLFAALATEETLVTHRTHANFKEVEALRLMYYSMGYEEQQAYLLRKLRDFTNPEDNKITYYYEKVLTH